MENTWRETIRHYFLEFFNIEIGFSCCQCVPYFLKILRENSAYLRGNIKRKTIFNTFPDGFFHKSAEVFPCKGHSSMVNNPVHELPFGFMDHIRIAYVIRKMNDGSLLLKNRVYLSLIHIS